MTRDLTSDELSLMQGLNMTLIYVELREHSGLPTGIISPQTALDWLEQNTTIEPLTEDQRQAMTYWMLQNLSSYVRPGP